MNNMELKEVLLYTTSALKDACYDKYWVVGIPKFIKEQDKHIKDLEQQLEELKERVRRGL